MNPSWEDLYDSFVTQLEPAAPPRGDDIKTYQSTLTDRLRKAGSNSPQLDAKLLIAHGLQLDPTALLTQGERTLTHADTACLETLAHRREAREPMSQILGYKDFWKDRFTVSRDVLTPRPDSETLIEAALEHMPTHKTPCHILDLGTGSGCLLLSALREYKHAIGLGVDLSPAALAIAKQNAQQLGLGQRAFFAASHWMQALQNRYDMIISNPPYIKRSEKAALDPEVQQYEPEGALFAGEDGLEAYSQIISALAVFLKKEGIALLELGVHQAQSVSNLAQQHGLKVIECRRDLGGIERALVLTTQ